MDTRVFAYVAKLADTGSYARAAQELFITKQGLASAIERLERSMGVPLFEADRKGVRLTEYGHVFCSFSRMFEERHRAMMDEIEQMRRREERAVTLAASTGLFNVITREDICAFSERNAWGARVKILRAVLDRDCETMLLEKACDFALLNNPICNEQLVTVPLHKDMMFFWVPAAHPLAVRGTASLADAEGCEVACLSPDEYVSLVPVAERLAREAPGCSLSYADQMIEVFERAMDRGTMSITVRSHVHSFPHEGYVGVPIEDAPWGFSVAYRRDRLLSRWDEAFLAYLSSLATFYC